MSCRQVNVPGIGKMVIYKRRDSRNIRLSITPRGTLRATIPYWAPYTQAVTFAVHKSEWITKQLSKTQPVLLKDGQQIGKAHHLSFSGDSLIQDVSSSTTGNNISIKYPPGLQDSDEIVQSLARELAVKALKDEANVLLPQRLEQLAKKFNYVYTSVNIRKLHSRWGSCSQNRDIKLSLYLMQLPWELIDYVLLHELAHTKVLHHGPDFWHELESSLPNARILRKQIRAYQSRII